MAHSDACVRCVRSLIIRLPLWQPQPLQGEIHPSPDQVSTHVEAARPIASCSLRCALYALVKACAYLQSTW